MAPLLELRDVSVQYDTQATPTLQHINLTIHQGEKILLTGRSGSGKSTLARLLNGLIPSEYAGTVTGRINLSGQDVTQQSVFKRSLVIGTVLQDSNAQFVGLTTGEDIAFALENDALVHSQLMAKVADWAAELHVTDLIDLAPQVLSGGEKQRVAMAGVLIDDEPILLLDEPLASLDPASGQRMMKLLSRLQAEDDLTIIIGEHRIEDILTGGVDRIVILDDGQVVSDATVPQTLTSGQLARFGLATPTYIQLLQAAGLDLKQVKNIEQPDELTAPDLEQRLKQFVASIESTPELSSGMLNDEIGLRIARLNFGYPTGQHIFTDFNLNFKADEMIAIVGKNGSGKSTLMQLIAGFLNPLSGEIRFKQTDLLALSIKERAQYIGYVAQNPNQMFTQANVFDEVAIGLRLRGIAESEIKTQVDRLLKIADLYEFRHWPVSVLSYGQKKRLSIIAVLILQPKVLILDEPTAGQDATHAKSLIQLVTELHHEERLTVILITHDMNLLQTVAQRTIAMVDGQVVADMEPSELLQNKSILHVADLRQTGLMTLINRFDSTWSTAQIVRMLNE
ncbi:DUF3744 domain-containing protein [Weissella diestrammenae]|uniref:DUF3744 domain-containing protein n=2 Tax=Weissella diestrammenae TaxID=1162633 RepID=A0A7G9T6Z7_9LACO|nr:ABC transporter ATP-binding protein [Weissella diestrammenae]QNN75872.1 DUF3744 domain-containing protein [Weissella diestrammenae]